MTEESMSVYDRDDGVHREVALVDLGDGTFAQSFANPPGRNLDVLVGDQVTDPFDVYMGIEDQSGITLTVAVDRGDRVINVSSGHGFDAGDYFVMSKPGRIYTGEVVSVATNAITLDVFVHDDFSIAETQILRGTKNLNVVGTAAAPKIAKIILPQYPGKIDITRVMIQMTCDTAPGWDTYGDIAKLTYGVHLRVVYDADLPTQRCVPVWNIKNNSQYALHAYDTVLYDAASPQAVNGVSVRSTFAGQSKRGVAIRMSSADQLRLIIQDDLSDLVSHHVMVEGHIVID